MSHVVIAQTASLDLPRPPTYGADIPQVFFGAVARPRNPPDLGCRRSGGGTMYAADV